MPPARNAHVPPLRAPARGDELAKFAMQCHLGGERTWGPDSADDIELRCHEVTGKVEARCITPWTQREPLTVGVVKDGLVSPFGVRGLNSDGQLDSPLEPGMAKREISFSTQMVRRAVSFILNDGAFENDPAIEHATRAVTNSPSHTAIAA